MTAAIPSTCSDVLCLSEGLSEGSSEGPADVRPMTWLFAALVGAACVVTSVQAHAEESPTTPPSTSVPVRVEYRSNTGCPVALFVDQLSSRSSRIHVAAEGEAATLLVVDVVRATRGARGDLAIHYADGTRARRGVDGDTCESVVSALALMSVLALSALDRPDVTPASPAVQGEPKPPIGLSGGPAAEHPQPVDLRPGWHLVALGGAGVTGGGSPSV